MAKWFESTLWYASDNLLSKAREQYKLSNYDMLVVLCVSQDSKIFMGAKLETWYAYGFLGTWNCAQQDKHSVSRSGRTLVCCVSYLTKGNKHCQSAFFCPILWKSSIELVSYLGEAKPATASKTHALACGTSRPRMATEAWLSLTWLGCGTCLTVKDIDELFCNLNQGGSLPLHWQTSRPRFADMHFAIGSVQRKKVDRIVDSWTCWKTILETWSFDRCSSLQKIAFQWTSPSWSRRQERHCWRMVIFNVINAGKTIATFVSQYHRLH